MSREQVYFEDLSEGVEIPALVKNTTNVQLFLFSAVTRINHSIHYSKEQAATDGHPDIVVHGPLQAAFLCQMVTDWMGDRGFLKKLSYQNRGVAFPGDTLTCKGTVTKKYVENGDHYVECDISLENQRGEICVPGTCLVILPSRTQP